MTIASRVLAVLIASTACANEARGSSDGYGTASAAGLGGGFWSNREELRASFARNGFELPSRVLPVFGLALSFTFHGAHVEAGGAFGNERLRSSAGTAELRSSHGWLDLGYELWRHEHTAIFPFVGVGFEELRVGFDPQAPPLLEDQTGELVDRLEIWRTRAQAHGGVGVDHVFPFQRRRGSDSAGLLLGARVGYRAPFSDGHYRNQGHEFSGGPRLGDGGPFVLVLVGVSSRAWATAPALNRSSPPGTR